MSTVGAKFTRNKEDFICEHCTAQIEGNGYTNHCPACLHSKHVDHNPGDRSNSCKGLMKPVALRKKGSALSIIHECQKCRERKANKVQKQDDMDLILKLTLL